MRQRHLEMWRIETWNAATPPRSACGIFHFGRVRTYSSADVTTHVSFLRI
jgi:hypothetical protein